jgi:hypothetical protein
MQAGQDEIASLLRQVKRQIELSDSDPARFVLSTRDKNLESIARLELNRDDVKMILSRLSVEDYCSGPSPDHQATGEVWIFGRVIQELPIYIKFKLNDSRDAAGVRVLSFHVAEEPLKYPFRSAAHDIQAT